MKHSLTVNYEHLGLRADKYLATQLTDLSRSKIQEILKAGSVKLNGNNFTDPSYKVRTDDVFEIFLKENKPIKIEPRNIPFEIIYEDKYLLVINKPAGLTVHPGVGNSNNTLVNALLHYCGDSLSSVSGEARPGIVHRLDKDTSGLMLIAKSDIVHAKLAEQLERREIKRVYHAMVYGVIQPIAGKISANISRDKNNHKIMTVTRSGGKTAVTHYKLLQNLYNTISLVECTLETGRTHQIRVHMLYKKHPILGDQVYAKGYNLNFSNLPEHSHRAISSLKRQALHAKELSFIHPISYKEIKFECNYPEDLNNVIKTLLLK